MSCDAELLQVLQAQQRPYAAQVHVKAGQLGGKKVTCLKGVQLQVLQPRQVLQV
jgi:hypothetical protein